MAFVLKVDTSGLQKLSKNIFVNQLPKGLTALAEYIAGDTREKINRGKRTGNLYQTLEKSGRKFRIYKNFKKGKPIKQASARGENPKTDTGFLVSNIQTNLKGIKQGKAQVLSRADYSSTLEDSKRFIFSDVNKRITNKDIERIFEIYFKNL